MSSLSRKLDRRQNKPMRAKGMVHHLIAKTAKELASTHWEALAKQNAFYRAYPVMQQFVESCWHQYIDMARQILTGMLGDPKYPEAMKADIHRALLLDGTINPKALAEPAKKPTLFKL